MKRKFNLLLGAVASLFVLSGCDGLSFITNLSKKAPTFKSIKVSTDFSSTRANNNVKHLGPGEEFFFEIHFDNPKSYSIDSFTINDVKYSSADFSESKAKDIVYLTSRSEISEGSFTYKIDAIKYKDGNNVKDVKIDGSQTATIKVDIPYKTFGDYTCATEIKDGGRYLLGVYKYDGTFNFINGDYHRDDNGPWSFYMGTVQNTTEGAVEVEAKYVSDDEFTLQVKAPGMVWDNKYISIYAGDGIYSRIPSIVGLNNVGDTDFICYRGQGIDEYTNKLTVSAFKYYGFYENTYVQSIGLTYPTVGSNAGFETFLGTSGEYTSVDCKRSDSAVGTEYNLARLYERVEA